MVNHGLWLIIAYYLLVIYSQSLVISHSYLWYALHRYAYTQNEGRRRTKNIQKVIFGQPYLESTNRKTSLLYRSVDPVSKKSRGTRYDPKC